MSFRRAILLTLITVLLIFCLSPGVMAAYNLRLEATSDGVTSKTAFSPGDDLYVNIVLDNAADVAGCAFILNYPPGVLVPPETDSDGQPVMSGEITSAFPFSYGSLDTHRENSSQPGQIYFTGAAIDFLDGGGKYDSEEVALFTVLFRVSDDAPTESFSLSLTQTELFNLDAGYGLDNNRNGVFDEGIDQKEKVSLLVGAVNNQDTDWDKLSSAFPVLLDDLAEPVTLNLAIPTDDPVDTDSDQDGLLDTVETNTGIYVDAGNTGTDPEKDDTDGDGLNDGEEVDTYYTNPVEDDTDGDGLNDGEEVDTYYTNPVEDDTDDDGMPDGWEVQYGLNPLEDEASEDLDDDGLTNLQEFCLGTDPAVPGLEPQRTITDAGSQQTVDEVFTVILNGLNSHAVNGTVDSYEWIQTEGTAVELSDPNDARTIFAAPDVGPNGESLLFELRIYDSFGMQSEDMTIVNVSWDNIPPVATAGNDQTVSAGDVVMLNGAGSTDPDGGIFSYQWTQLKGNSVELSDSTASQPTFTAPGLCLDGETLTFRLVVTDNGGLKALDTCIINVSEANNPPTAVAGDNQTVEESSTVTLNGADSMDTDDGVSSYQWTQIQGTPVTFSDPTSPAPTFVAPPVNTDGKELVFMLILTDAGGLQASDRVSMLISDNGITGFSDNVITINTSTGENIGFEVQDGGDFVSIKPIDPSTIGDDPNMPEDLVYGLFDMRIRADTVGGTVTIISSFPTPAPDDCTWFKYSPDNGWTDFSSNVMFNSTREEMTITLVDGGTGDDDGEADGTIVDPSGLALATGSDDDDGSDDETSTTAPAGDSGGCFIGTALDNSILRLNVKLY